MERKQRFDPDKMELVLRDYKAGKKIKELCQTHDISKSTFYYWLSKHGEANPNQDERMKALKTENAQLRRLLTDRILNTILERGLAALGPEEFERLLRVDNNLDRG